MKKLTVALMGLCAALLFAVFAVGPARIAAAAVNMSTVAASGNYLATPTAPGFESVQDKLGTTLIARWKTSCVLPAYTESGAAGSEVLTANANGALGTNCTDGVTPNASGDTALIDYNDTSTPDAGLFTFVQGTGGTPWVFTRKSTEGANTAARLQGSVVRVAEGFEAGIYVCSQNTITVGTTPLLWRKPGFPDTRHGWSACTAFNENSAIVSYAANVTAGGATVSNGLVPYYGYLANSQGAVANISNNTVGQATFATGTATGGIAQMVTANVDPTTARFEAEYSVRWNVPTVSDGTNTFSVGFGLLGDANNFSRITLTPTAGAAINHVTSVGGVAGATRQLCAACFAAGTDYRYVLRKAFGASVWGIWFDPGTGVLAYINDTPTLPTSVQLGAIVQKSAGTTSRTMVLSDMCGWVYDPKVWG